jgi:hypothetical protein
MIVQSYELMLSMHTQHSPKVFGVDENKVKKFLGDASTY